MKNRIFLKIFLFFTPLPHGKTAFFLPTEVLVKLFCPRLSHQSDPIDPDITQSVGQCLDQHSADPLSPVFRRNKYVLYISIGTAIGNGSGASDDQVVCECSDNQSGTGKSRKQKRSVIVFFYPLGGNIKTGDTLKHITGKFIYDPYFDHQSNPVDSSMPKRIFMHWIA